MLSLQQHLTRQELDTIHSDEPAAANATNDLLGLEMASNVGVSCLRVYASARVDEVPHLSLHASTTLEQSKDLPKVRNRTSHKVFLHCLPYTPVNEKWRFCTDNPR
jgi:hypothetical protein